MATDESEICNTQLLNLIKIGNGCAVIYTVLCCLATPRSFSSIPCEAKQLFGFYTITFPLPRDDRTKTCIPSLPSNTSLFFGTSVALYTYERIYKTHTRSTDMCSDVQNQPYGLTIRLYIGKKCVSHFPILKLN